MTDLYIRLATGLRDDEGATAVEYGLLVALVAAAIAVAALALGADISAVFDRMVTSIPGGPAPAP